MSSLDLSSINTLSSLQAFEESGLDLGRIAHLAFDWAGEKKSTKPVVKALAQALQATADVQGVRVSRYAQGIEMLSFAAACAPLLDSDRLARLIELAPSTLTAYQPIEDVQAISQGLSLALGQVTQERRETVLKDLWASLHRVRTLGAGPAEETWFPEVDCLPFLDSHWDGETLTGIPTSMEWWVGGSVRNDVNRLVAAAKVHGRNPAGLVNALAETVKDIEIVLPEKIHWRSPIVDLLYPLQVQAGVVHEPQFLEELRQRMGRAWGVKSADVLEYLDPQVWKALSSLGVRVEDAHFTSMDDDRVEELRSTVSDEVEERLLGTFIRQDVPVRLSQMAFLTGAAIERLCSSEKHLPQMRAVIGLERVSASCRRKVLLAYLEDGNFEYYYQSPEVLATGAELLEWDELIAAYKRFDAPYRSEFLLGASLPIVERFLGLEKSKGVRSRFLGGILLRGGKSPHQSLIRPLLDAVDDEEGLSQVVSYLTSYQSHEGRRIHPSLTVGDVVNLVDSCSTGPILLRGAYADDDLLGSEFWEERVTTEQADLSTAKGIPARLVAQGIIPSASLGSYAASHDSDVREVVATSPVMSPLSRPESEIQVSVVRVAEVLEEGVEELPKRPRSWSEYVDLQPTRHFEDYPEEIYRLDGMLLPKHDATLRLIRSSAELEANAAYMGNCTAGYQDEAEEGCWALYHLTVGTEEYNISVRVGDEWYDDETPSFEVEEVNTRFNRGVVDQSVRTEFEALLQGLTA